VTGGRVDRLGLARRRAVAQAVTGDAHHWRGSFSGTGRGVGWNTADPATSRSGSASGYWAGSGGRSASVTCRSPRQTARTGQRSRIRDRPPSRPPQPRAPAHDGVSDQADSDDRARCRPRSCCSRAPAPIPRTGCCPCLACPAARAGSSGLWWGCSTMGEFQLPAPNCHSTTCPCRVAVDSRYARVNLHSPPARCRVAVWLRSAASIIQDAKAIAPDKPSPTTAPQARAARRGQPRAGIAIRRPRAVLGQAIADQSNDCVSCSCALSTMGCAGGPDMIVSRSTSRSGPT
jgi:hypothetical protein